MDANLGLKVTWLKSAYVLIAVLIALRGTDHLSLAAVWDYGCEGAIGNLRTEQEEVESAHDEFESAKNELEFARSMYSLCTPTLYGDCEFERMNVNNAIQEYNDALETLKSRLGDFEYAVSSFKHECLL